MNQESPSEKSEITVAAAVIVREDHCFLLARKRQGFSNGGLWEFPGGKVESGERPSDALERELIEELGLFLSETPLPLLEYYWTNPKTIIHFHFFIVRLSTFIPESKDHDDFRWISADEIKSLKLNVVEADKQALAFLAEFPGSLEVNS